MIIDKDKFIKSYNKIVKSINSDSSNMIFSYTSEFENDNFENLLDSDNNIFKNYIMWIRKSKKFKFLSLGSTQECNLSNQNKIQFNSMVETLIKNRDILIWIYFLYNGSHSNAEVTGCSLRKIHAKMHPC